MQFPQNIFTLLEQKRLTATQMAKHLDCSEASINGWKNGSYPSSKYVIRICEFLNISPNYLLTGQELLQNDLTPDETEWLELYRKLDSPKQLEHRLELRGYIRANEENKTKTTEKTS